MVPRSERFQRLFRLLAWPWRAHLPGSLLILLFVVLVMGVQIGNRRTFAAGELYEEVMDRWGAPIVQPAPSVRFVESGSVFTQLEPLPLASQEIDLVASMSYRRRGLVFFSGFDFELDGRFAVENDRDHPMDLVFVLPIQASRTKVLLSDLTFTIDGEEAPIAFSEGRDRLVWTGRLEPGDRRSFEVSFRGRGLDSFVYRLDPSLPVRGFRLGVAVSGGDEIDYPPGAISAHSVEATDRGIALEWRFGALESGVPVGVVLPSVQAWDELIGVMLRRALVPGGLYFMALGVVAAGRRRPLRWLHAHLLAAIYAFFYVLLPYLAAFLAFGFAYLLALGISGGLSAVTAGRLLGTGGGRVVGLLVGATLGVPTLAVIAQGYTGLIYTLEILAALVLAARLSTRPEFDDRFGELLASAGVGP